MSAAEAVSAVSAVASEIEVGVSFNFLPTIQRRIVEQPIKLASFLSRAVSNDHRAKCTSLTQTTQTEYGERGEPEFKPE